MSYDLRQPKIVHLGLVAMVQRLRQDLYSKVQQKDVTVVVPDFSLCRYSIAERCLKNAVKHVSERNARFSLRGAEEEIRLRPEDSRSGFDAGSSVINKALGFKLRRERLYVVGGNISNESHASDSKRIDARVPLGRQVLSCKIDRQIRKKVLRAAEVKPGYREFPQTSAAGRPRITREGVRTMKSPRIILADDHALLLGAFKSFLEPEFDVVATFLDGRTLTENAKALSPDLIVLDIGMPFMNGLSAGQRLKQEIPSVKLIYLTMNQDPDLAAEAFRLGASGYILKNSAASELAHAIREALIGRSYVTPLITEGMVGSFVKNLKLKKPTHKLTLRQKEVLQLLAEGRSMKEVAAILNVTPRTVAFHKYTMMEQLNVKTGAELIHYAITNSIIAA